MSESKKSGTASRKEIKSTDEEEHNTGDVAKPPRESRKARKKIENPEESELENARAAKKARKEKRRLEKAAQKKKDESNCSIDANIAATAATATDPNSVSGMNSLGKKESKRIKKREKQQQGSNLSTKSANEKHEKGVVDDNLVSVSPQDKRDRNQEKGYIENNDLSAQPQDIIDSFLTDNFISITDPLSTKPSLRPIFRFSYLPISDPTLLAHLKNFETPTPIQAASWPYLFASRDLVGVAETGSGKTMAFAIPCVTRIILSKKLNSHARGVRALVVSPTRELAMQSYEQINQLCTTSGVKAVCIYGGVPKDEQRRALKTADIIVATPGRLNDLLNEGCTDLSKVEYLVLDEADRMLDKGFEEEIKKIINTTPGVGIRQTLMFTATWPESVQSLASTFMKTPVMILIGDNKTGDLRANNRIVQKVDVIEPRNKEYRLLQILKEHQSGSKKDDRIIVFALYKKEATRVEGFIRSKGFRVAGIHGDLSQEQRTRSLDAFKKGNTPILVATDVAARGLDIPSVKLVLNLTFPLTVEDYVHRIGRTGRAGKQGLAITLFTEHDKSHSGALINVLKAAKQEVPEELLKFGTTVKRKEHEAYGAFAKDVDMTKKAKKIKFD
ncbi:ATP-dependent RNA helicase dbp3 [Erysiphe neolycopersici]|uniref:RNA helicase n=1 Tax=Erysiphe neolycopersici TaxID=212602 RepID=A0A420I302_9PEZI|nr:ATP-dependent RNA helicase dbp3 [Erysiphe neolycopersici]